MELKDCIVALIDKSGLTNKEVLGVLDGVRALYHDRRNVGDKVLSEREHSSKYEAEIKGVRYPLSKDKKFVYYKGDWKKVYGFVNARFVTYLGTSITVLFRVK